MERIINKKQWVIIVGACIGMINKIKLYPQAIHDENDNMLFELFTRPSEDHKSFSNAILIVGDKGEQILQELERLECPQLKS